MYDDDTPVDIGVLYMTFLDIDGRNEGSEVVRLHGADSYVVDSNTDLTITTGNLKFSSKILKADRGKLIDSNCPYSPRFISGS